MRATPLKTLSALLLAAAVVGCASKKIDDTAEAETTPPPAEQPAAEPAGAEAAEVAGVDENAPISQVEPDAVDGAAAATEALDGFESNAAHYPGDTRGRVVYFGFDRAEIPQAAYATLQAHAKYLAGNPKAMLRIEGNCDERGTPEYNVALGERRAKSLKQFLELNGAGAAQIEVVSYGEEKPAELGHDELSWAKNRRGELVYTAGQP